MINVWLLGVSIWTIVMGVSMWRLSGYVVYPVFPADPKEYNARLLSAASVGVGILGTGLSLGSLIGLI